MLPMCLYGTVLGERLPEMRPLVDSGVEGRIINVR
jgi:hypothetical protein